MPCNNPMDLHNPTVMPDLQIFFSLIIFFSVPIISSLFSRTFLLVSSEMVVGKRVATMVLLIK